MAFSHQAWGRGWKEQEAPGLRSEAWLASQIAPGSAANPREEHDTPPPPSLPTNQGRVWRWGTQCKASTSEVMVLVWGMGQEGRGSEEIWASGRVNHAHVRRVSIALAYPERRHSP